MPAPEVIDAVMLHYQLQHGTYFDCLVQSRAAIVATSSVPGCIWNHAAVLPGGKVPTGAWVDDVRGQLGQLSRPLAVYVEQSMNTAAEGLLVREGLVHVDTEAWMFMHPDQLIEPSVSPNLVLTTPRGEAALAINDLVTECFDADHTQAICQESPLGERGRVGRRFLLESNGEPVGAATALYRYGWVVLHDICVKPDYRGRDLGFQLVNRVLADVVQTWRVAGVFLQCDGGRLEHFYGRSGFRTRYVRHGYATEVPPA